MGKIQTLLVAVAQSPSTEVLFDYAAQLASQLGARLLVASIINDRDVSAVRRIVEMGYEVDGEHYVSGVKEERRRQLETLVSNSGLPADGVEMVFKVGNPTEELLKIIVSRQVDMVVMGLKGSTELEHALAGSVAHKMFHRSPATIVSFRDEAQARRLQKRIRT